MGKSVYLRDDELRLIRTMFSDAMSFPDPEIDEIRKRIKNKMDWHLKEVF